MGNFTWMCPVRANGAALGAFIADTLVAQRQCYVIAESSAPMPARCIAVWGVGLSLPENMKTAKGRSRSGHGLGTGSITTRLLRV